LRISEGKGGVEVADWLEIEMIWMFQRGVMWGGGWGEVWEIGKQSKFGQLDPTFEYTQKNGLHHV